MIKEMNSDEEADFALALQLQNDIMEIGDYDEVYASPRRNSDGKQVHSSEAPLSIVDDSWELIDPVPDIRELFVQFNEEYFEGKLAGVEVRWSPRMTLCAGLCCYEGRGGLCSIRLSQPLLKLRPRRDLVQTLLHEMIHALLFVTNNNKDHDSHGPEFHKHMDRINKSTGSKITVYHTFHDEVDEYRQHWWRCNGPCVRKRPFFGIVRRAMNRAPSPRDPWWADHRAKCGGDFIKIKEPDGYAKKPSKKNASKQDVAELKSSAASKRGDDGARAVITDWFKRDGGSASAGSDSTIPSLKRKTFSQSSSSISSGIPPLLNGDAAKRQATQRNIRTLNDFGASESFQSGGRGDTSLDRGVLSRNCDSGMLMARFPGTGHVLGSAPSSGSVVKETRLAPLLVPPVSNSQFSRSSVVTGGGRASTLSRAATTEVSLNAKVASSALHGSAVAVDIDSDDRCARRRETGGKACGNAGSELAVVQCPACMQTIPEEEINLHLDTCLTS